MDKNTKPILITIIIIMAISIIYLLATRNLGVASSKQPSVSNRELNNNAPAEALTAAKTKEPNYMEPQLPAGLTDQQKAELKAGAAEHSPASLTFNVTGGSFYFSPNEIKVKQGDKVKINFTNAGGFHNLILETFGVQTKTVKIGESDSIEFTADKKGTFEFYCGVGNGYHRQMGQIGVLIVE